MCPLALNLPLYCELPLYASENLPLCDEAVKTSFVEMHREGALFPCHHVITRKEGAKRKHKASDNQGKLTSDQTS